MSNENKQTGSRYPLFEHMSNEYGLHLFDSEIDEITRLSAEINGVNSLRQEIEDKDDNIKHADIRIHQLEYERELAEKEIEQLRSWKESAMKTFSDLNLQECANLLNIGLGHSIAVNLVPKIKELKKEVNDLKDTVRVKSEHVKTMIRNMELWDKEQAELNERIEELVEALENTQKIQEVFDECTPLDMLIRVNNITLEALKRRQGGK